MVHRIFVEKKKDFANEAKALLNDVRSFIGISEISDLRLWNRYDAENIDSDIFDAAAGTVFSEPQVDIISDALPDTGDAHVFAVEYLPGQFDQRADSAAQCIQLLSRKEKPIVRSAKVYALYGCLTDEHIAAIKKYVINPVESREASLAVPETLKIDLNTPGSVEILHGFTDMSEAGLRSLIDSLGLAMDIDDILFCREYFRSEHREPTITEIKVIDTYWSDHCRHTTFNTVIDNVEFADEVVKREFNKYLDLRRKLDVQKPVTLMDIGTIAARALKKEGKLTKLDESDEINACTVKIEIEADGRKEPWLLLFKNETHNHPTEIEPFGGAATCIGGAIRDPLSGRAYVYAAMRLTGAADPLAPVGETLPGKLPQRKIVITAANGYSSYGNQIGLATGLVDELYHPGYVAKRMEIGAVIAAAPEENIIRLKPIPGDKVIYIGGATGRDGIGGATGSSKAHNAHSVEECGAEVQKGNAPEERKIQRLFRNPEVSKLIKKCNDFGAGGVSVAIGELAEGLLIDLDKVPKKYEGLDGTELAISESQERMAVVVASGDAARFIDLARTENLTAVEVAEVRDDDRLVMMWHGSRIVDISRGFLDTSGAEKHISISTGYASDIPGIPNNTEHKGFEELLRGIAADLNTCSKRGLSERFDSTVGAGNVLMPFGGKYQLTPIQSMVYKISSERKHTDDVSVMSWGFNPYISEADPFRGAYLAVCDSIAKLIAAGAGYDDIYLSFQEYFAKPGKDPSRWGDPLCSLLGALRAQMDLGIAAIGGKDSMSGSFENLDVPPTLVSFAVTTSKVSDIVSPEFKAPGHTVICVSPGNGPDGLPRADSFREMLNFVTSLLRDGLALSAYVTDLSGPAGAVLRMSFGNMTGFDFSGALSLNKIFGPVPLSIVLELGDSADTELSGDAPFNVCALGKTTSDPHITYAGETVSLTNLLKIYEEKLESVFCLKTDDTAGIYDTFDFPCSERKAPLIKKASPRAVIPVFPGTNCEYDSAFALSDAGIIPEIYVVRNLTPDDVRQSVEEFASIIRQSQLIMIPGGFSAGDEPDGSGKFITAFFRNGSVRDAVTELLDKREGLILGICNGFQALIKLGLLPYGRITDADADSPTLTFNTIGRHQSRLVRTRVASNLSPWLSFTSPGEIYTVPVSCGEGRFIADEKTIRELGTRGQIALQYVDDGGLPSSDVRYNPTGSMFAVEGITSPDGRVFGKMGHTERFRKGLYKNVPGNYDMHMYEAAASYFKGG